MTASDTPGFFARLALAFSVFFKVLFDAAFAGRLKELQVRSPASALPRPAVATTHRVPRMLTEDQMKRVRPRRDSRPTPASPGLGSGENGALQVLAALQREGRFVDFVKEDVASVSDTDLGAAARLVHAGSRRVVDSWFTVEAIWPGEEGAPAVVQAGFDARRIRLTGNVTGDPPFRGSLTHHGWRAAAVKLPTLGPSADPTVLCPAEVEL